jgi:hypothetical protein
MRDNLTTLLFIEKQNAFLGDPEEAQLPMILLANV